MDRHRRAFLQGNFRQKGTVIEDQIVTASDLQPLPWFNGEKAVGIDCSSCMMCIESCPTQIIEISNGAIGVNFNKGECEFCRRCADICPSDLFKPSNDTPWEITAVIKEACLANLGVVCQTCHEQCPFDAINITHRLGTVPSLEIDADKCTGCGACLAPCPASAIEILPDSISD